MFEQMLVTSAAASSGADYSTEFRGRRVAISGATGGFGRAIAERFHEAGATLCLLDRGGSQLEEMAREMRAEAWKCDQSAFEAIPGIAASLGPVDIFVNNAGITIRKPLLEMPHSEIRSIIDINLTGAMLMAIEVARHMKTDPTSVIVNVASQIVFAGGEGRGAYAASKAGIVQFTKTSAVEWARRGIRVVGVAPGAAETPMTADLRKSPEAMERIKTRVPSGRLIPAGEIAEFVCFLASSRAQAVVGQTLVIDDGFLLT